MTSSFIRLGSEFAINTLTAQNQSAPSVASFENGNFVAIWVSADTAQDGSDSAIKGQLLSASGVRIGAEFLVNTAALGPQFTPAVTTFGEDRFIVTWVTTDPAQDGSGNAIKAQIFDSTGAKIGAEFLVNSQVSGSQFTPNVAELASGGFVISWDDWSGFDMKAQVFDASGGRAGVEFRVNTRTDGFEEYGDIVGLTGGGFVATWRTTDSTVDGSNDAVMGQIFDSTGRRVGSEFLINSRVTGYQNEPTLAALANGGFAVAWNTSDPTQDGSDSAIKAQIFSATGSRLGGEFQVNSQVANRQYDPQIVGLADGGFAATWVTFDPLQDGSSFAVKAQIFDVSGNKVGSEFLVETLATGTQFLPEIEQLGNGNLLTAWTSETGDGSGYAVRGQIFESADGGSLPEPPPPAAAQAVTYFPSGLEFQANSQTIGSQSHPVVAGFSDGCYIIAWDSDDAAQDGNGSALKTQMFSSSGSKIGSELIVNTQTNGNQYSASVTIINDDQYVVAWVTSDTAQDGSRTAIKAQLFDKSGIKIGGEFLVNSQVADFQFTPNVARLAGGGFVISWDDYVGADMKAQIFGNAGERIGSELLVNTSTSGSENLGDIVGLAGGGFAVTWQTSDASQDGSGSAIKGRIFDAAGVPLGPDFLVNSQGASYQQTPSIGTLAGGGFVIVWSTLDSAQDGSSSAVKAQLFNANGIKIGIEFLVNTLTMGSIGEPSVVGLADGGFAVVWGGYASSSNEAIKAQIFDANGLKVGGELFANVPASSAISPTYPEIAQLANGDLIVSWMSKTDGSGYAVRATLLEVNVAPDIISNGGGETASIWHHENGSAVTTVTAIDAHILQPLRFSLTGGTDAELFTIDAATGALAFAAAPDFEAPDDVGRDNVYDVIVAVTDGELTTKQRLLVTVSDVDETESLVITSDGGGDVTALSRVENLTTVTTVGAIAINAGNVTYAVTAGTDAALFTIDPITGVLSFRSAPNYEAPADADHDNVYEVVIQASAGNATDTQSLTITVGNDMSETFTGTAARDILTGTIDGDTLLGLAGDDDLVAGDGDDVLNGGAGNDRLDGGAGSDSAIYADAAGAVRVDLQLAIAQNTGAAGKDLLIGVEHLTGSAFNDQLSGNDLDNRLIGGAGIDTIKGAAGDDMLIGDDGNDLIEGGAGADLVAGGAGNDRLRGGADHDSLIGGDGNDTLDGETGADILEGGAGNDIYFVDDSGDIVTETDAAIATGGVDLVRASISHVLGDNVEKLTLVDPTGSSGPADIDGTGNALGNIVIGNGGDNAIRGLDGNDTLDGGAGDDLIVGGLGNDALTGGAGRDIFLYDTEGGTAGRDTIKDFAAGTDRIALALSAFGALAGDGPGILSTAAFTIGTRATSADHHIVYNGATGALYYDADGAGGLAQMQIATLIGRPTLSEVDFVLI